MFTAGYGRSRLAAVGVFVAVVALACGTAGGVAAARTGSAVHPQGWRVRLMDIPPRSARWPFVLELAADSPADAWGVGFVNVWPLVDHWNGTRWRRVILPRPVARQLGALSMIVALSASSPRNVWMFGQTSDEAGYGSSHGIWLRYDGTRWRWGKVTLRGSTGVTASLAVGRRAVWAFGDPAGHVGYAWYHDRGGWTRFRLPGRPGDVIGAAAGTGSDLWALESHWGAGPSGTLLRWARGRWHLIPLPRSMQHGTVSSVVACGPDCALVGGAVRNRKGGTTPAVGRWTGRRWTVAILPARPGAGSDAVTSLVTAGPGRLLATSSGTPNAPAPRRLWQYRHGRWTQVHLVTILDMAAIPRTTSVWATAIYASHFKFALISRLP
jgi:hypothetical protein